MTRSITLHLVVGFVIFIGVFEEVTALLTSPAPIFATRKRCEAKVAALASTAVPPEVSPLDVSASSVPKGALFESDMSESFSTPLALKKDAQLATITTTTAKSNHKISNFSTNASSKLFDWSFIDKIYLITCPNADPGSARLNKSLGILSKLGVLDGDEVTGKFQIKEFDTDDEDRIRGCYASHISVLRDALAELRQDEAGGTVERQHEWWVQFVSFLAPDGTDDANGYVKKTKNNHALQHKGQHQKPQGSKAKFKNAAVLVLEDNLDFTGNLRQSTLDAIATFAGKQGNEDDSPAVAWDMIHLSYIPYVPNLFVSKTSVSKNVVQLRCGVGSALGTTAYIINTRGIQTLLSEDDVNGGFNGAAIPDVMAKLFPETRYSSFPTPFLRAPTTKSLVNPQLDGLRSVLFQPVIVSTVQNGLATTGMSSNRLLFVTTGALLVMAAGAGKVTLDAALDMIATGGVYNKGNLVLSILSAAFSFFSLAILTIGAVLAPKQTLNAEVKDDRIEDEKRIVTTLHSPKGELSSF